MDYYVLTRKYHDALEKYCSAQFDVWAMTCYNFGDDPSEAAKLLALAAGDPSLEEKFIEFFKESKQLYFDGFLKVVKNDA